MELDRAFELAGVAAWGDLVKLGYTSSVHLQYEKEPHSPLTSLSVWTIRNRGYGTLVCRCSVAPDDSAPFALEFKGMHFSNSYQSQILADCLEFVVRNEGQFTRPADRSIHGLVQVDSPSEEDRSEAATWSRSISAEFAEAVWT